MVLGSAQKDSIVDRESAAGRGVDVVRRRSGGGAVWLDPDSISWVDVVVPKGDPLWSEDVGEAFAWVGAAWAAALIATGLHDVSVHSGALERTAWSSLVCFAGRGPGEVFSGDRKVVGLAQKRTRGGALFQCGVLHRWDPTPLLEVLQLTDRERSDAAEELSDVCTGAPVAAVDAFVAQLAGDG